MVINDKKQGKQTKSLKNREDFWFSFFVFSLISSLADRFFFTTPGGGAFGKIFTLAIIYDHSRVIAYCIVL